MTRDAFVFISQKLSKIKQNYFSGSGGKHTAKGDNVFGDIFIAAGDESGYHPIPHAMIDVLYLGGGEVGEELVAEVL